MLLAIFDREQRVTAPLIDHGSQLMDRLDERSYELVAARVAARRDNRYIWTAHCETSLTRGVLSHDELVRVTAGPTAFRGREAALLWAVDHVLARRPVDDQTRAELEGDLLSVILAVGFYETIAYVTHDLGPEPDVGTTPGIETPARARGSYSELES